jgi:hypothetical protein
VAAEEVVRVPRGTRWILRDEPAAKIDELSVFHGLVEIEAGLCMSSCGIQSEIYR